MTPNPQAVLKDYIDKKIYFSDERVQLLVKIGWLYSNGQMTLKGIDQYKKYTKEEK